jgi:hypothetical protein
MVYYNLTVRIVLFYQISLWSMDCVHSVVQGVLWSPIYHILTCEYLNVLIVLFLSIYHILKNYKNFIVLIVLFLSIYHRSINYKLYSINCSDCRSLTKFELSEQSIRYINKNGCVWLKSYPCFEKSLKKTNIFTAMVQKNIIE